MESENLIFLSLFVSLLLILWTNTLSPAQFETVPQSSLKQTGVEFDAVSSNIFFVGINVTFLRRNFSFFLSSVFVFFANFLLGFLLLRRWLESGYPPFSNLYESLLFLTWCLLFLYFLVIDFQTFFRTLVKPRGDEAPRSSSPETSGPLGTNFVNSATFALSTAGPQENFEKFKSENKTDDNFSTEAKISNKLSSLIGFLLVSSSLFIYTFATWLLPSSMKVIQPLVPALKSNWLFMHVSIMILSYAALLAGSLFSILYLVLFYKNQSKVVQGFPLVGKAKPPETGGSTAGGLRPGERRTGEGPLWSSAEGRDLRSSGSLSSLGASNSSGVSTLPQLTGVSQVLLSLDSLSYRSLAVAFPLLTLGILSGSVWANEAWGSYWSWDPKETWALITWFFYSIYLHLRIQKLWAGEKAAWVASGGFFVVWICYLGVNLLGKGLHSYGWWN